MNTFRKNTKQELFISFIKKFYIPVIYTLGIFVLIISIFIFGYKTGVNDERNSFTDFELEANTFIDTNYQYQYSLEDTILIDSISWVVLDNWLEDSTEMILLTKLSLPKS
jgi:hypothetical protein